MYENLKLERIRVNNLFNRLTYDINLDNGYNIGVLIAPNGCGKTTIFKLVNFIFRPTPRDVLDIIKVPFDSCECTLSNGYVISLNRESAPIDEMESNEDYLQIPGQESGVRTSVKLTIVVPDRDPIVITKRLRDLVDRYGDDFLLFDDVDNDGPDLDEIDAMHMPPRYRLRYRTSIVWANIRSYLHDSGCDLSVNFIRADRLHSNRYTTGRRAQLYHRASPEVQEGNPLLDIQEKLQQRYKAIADEYNTLQRNMKDRLPKLYLEKDDESVKMKYPEFEREWNEYLSNIQKFCDIGLLPSDQNVLRIDNLEDAFNRRKAFLTVYLETFKKTLEPLERDYERLKLFVDILNHRNQVTHKTFRYDEKGIVIHVGNQELPLDCLSSGEKNDFIMFYNLIFASERNGLVLIDEPEISLHIAWQEEYLDRLLEICELNSLQAIIATHSPNIVNGHVELYVERDLSDNGF